MFYVFLISILQTCFIPGYIFLQFFKRKDNTENYLLTPVFSFGLTLIINYVVISPLAYLHLYTRESLYLYMGIEAMLLIYILIRERSNTVRVNFKSAVAEIRKAIIILKGDQRPYYRSAEFIMLLASLSGLVYLTAIMVLNTGKIFSGWDAVFSWNRWAIDFFNNKFPPHTYHYPQLIPANWSVSYVLSGYPFQFVPKGIMPLFLILSVYALIVTGLLRRKPYLIYSVIFLAAGMYYLNWDEGFADVPVAFFVILVLVCLFLIDLNDSSENQRFIFLGALFSCAAAVTKQAGLYIVVMYPLLLFIFHLKKAEVNNRKITGFIFLFMLMIITVILPYYVYAETAIRKGTSESEIRWVTNEIYNGASFPQRFLHACILYSNVFMNRVLFVLTIIPFLMSFKDRLICRLNIFFLLPYAALWAFFYSYDLRNAAIIIPSFCIGIGYGISIILENLKKHLKQNDFA